MRKAVPFVQEGRRLILVRVPLFVSPKMQIFIPYRCSELSENDNRTSTSYFKQVLGLQPPRSGDSGIYAVFHSIPVDICYHIEEVEKSFVWEHLTIDNRETMQKMIEKSVGNKNEDKKRIMKDLFKLKSASEWVLFSLELKGEINRSLLLNLKAKADEMAVSWRSEDYWFMQGLKSSGLLKEQEVDEIQQKIDSIQVQVHEWEEIKKIL